MKLTRQFTHATLTQKQEVAYVRGAIFIVMLGLFVGMMALVPADASVSELQISVSDTL
jgi:hypothetical protein